MFDQKTSFESQINELKETFTKQLDEFKAESEKSLRKQEEAAAEFKETETNFQGCDSQRGVNVNIWILSK